MNLEVRGIKEESISSKIFSKIKGSISACYFKSMGKDFGGLWQIVYLLRD